MTAPALVFLTSPAGQALLTGLMEEAPRFFGKVLGIWGKEGTVSPEEVATFISGYKPSGTFYPTGTPTGTYTGAITGGGSSAGGTGK